MHFKVIIAAVKRYCEPVLLAKFTRHEVSRSLIESQPVKHQQSEAKQESKHQQEIAAPAHRSVYTKEKKHIPSNSEPHKRGL
ncbi:uncharacterized protein K444DRAFT_81592 [Hyaloscypha bicolor E]|jgi:hypothetical protein|uniref:Uncharacterized protein n=1 Tax=Hyaloscypha bicolor E TaxID=1095630 RepID=A0A2J6SYK5_9HELO|nr:uncharacterized protein K444DRAFT_81592 [Hyaloscypha bicolor E]PMD55847.1 hypothetical protein K444DRAFT_81592 [Hyaloscypha bicolor E]